MLTDYTTFDVIRIARDRLIYLDQNEAENEVGKIGHNIRVCGGD